MPNGTYERITKFSDTLLLSLKLRERDPNTEKGPHVDPGPQMGTHVASAMGTSFGNIWENILNGSSLYIWHD